MVAVQVEELGGLAKHAVHLGDQPLVLSEYRCISRIGGKKQKRLLREINIVKDLDGDTVMEDDLGPKPRGLDAGSGTMITGLYLEGAEFELKNKHIAELASVASTAFKMPIIILTPAPLREQRFEVDSMAFQCPLYRAPDRRGTLTTTGHSTNFVCLFEMNCAGDKPAKHWLRRGAALLCEPPY